MQIIYQISEITEWGCRLFMRLVSKHGNGLISTMVNGYIKLYGKKEEQRGIFMMNMKYLMKIFCSDTGRLSLELK